MGGEDEEREAQPTNAAAARQAKIGTSDEVARCIGFS
jgi:hypothetical protein